MVDDEPSYLRLIVLVLQRYGYLVLSASSGEAAVELAGEADVALVDMMMPGMDGLETIPLLQWHNPHLKVIASSERSEDDFRPELDRLGVEVFMAKPFPIEELMEQIDELRGSVAA